MFLSDHIIDTRDEPPWFGPTQPDQAVTLFDGLFLSQLKRYKLEI